jgi:hypothetical protein
MSVLRREKLLRKKLESESVTTLFCKWDLFFAQSLNLDYLSVFQIGKDECLVGSKTGTNVKFPLGGMTMLSL